MGFQHRSEPAAMSEINVTPLVDVMLVLLVVFIVTAPLLMQAVRVNLPKTAAVAPAAQGYSVQLSVDAKGAVFLDRRPVGPGALEQALRGLAAREPGVALEVHADGDVPYRRVAQVLAQAQRAGLAKVALVTVPAR